MDLENIKQAGHSFYEDGISKHWEISLKLFSRFICNNRNDFSDQKKLALRILMDQLYADFRKPLMMLSKAIYESELEEALKIVKDIENAMFEIV